MVALAIWIAAGIFLLLVGIAVIGIGIKVCEIVVDLVGTNVLWTVAAVMLYLAVMAWTDHVQTQETKAKEALAIDRLVVQIRAMQRKEGN